MTTQHADLPQRFNFAHHILTLNQGRKNKLAFRDDHRELSYGELDLKVRQFAAGLLDHGIQPEQRILLVMHDSVDMPVAFLGALFAGVIPVPVNTLLPADNYAYMIKHSEAKMIVVSEALLPTVKEALTLSNQTIPVVVTGQAATSAEISFSVLLNANPLTIDQHADTHADTRVMADAATKTVKRWAERLIQSPGCRQIATVLRHDVRQENPRMSAFRSAGTTIPSSYIAHHSQPTTAIWGQPGTARKTLAQLALQAARTPEFRL